MRGTDAEICGKGGLERLVGFVGAIPIGLWSATVVTPSFNLWRQEEYTNRLLTA